MNYLVIDLEMCKVPKHYRNKDYRYAHETIQIGAVLLDENYRQIGSLSQYVHPEHGVIDHFIENLTGIRNHNVKNAPLLKEALEHMIDWLGDREYTVFSWSGTDREQILHEIKAKVIESQSIDTFMEADRWVDYQEVFSKRYGFSRRLSLEEALGRAEIEVEGRLHDGLVDAVNTGRLIEKLELNPDYQLVAFEMKETDTEPLSYSLGDLFAGILLSA